MIVEPKQKKRVSWGFNHIIFYIRCWNDSDGRLIEMLLFTLVLTNLIKQLGSKQNLLTENPPSYKQEKFLGGIVQYYTLLYTIILFSTELVAENQKGKVTHFHSFCPTQPSGGV